ncbi:MAG: hypothetical protein EU547_04295 [Promethearchaeota archaeon]|nr:MAG: hypothetical protein EU547_04295 [Candidatus Lokiarchaeota archaeon]
MKQKILITLNILVMAYTFGFLLTLIFPFLYTRPEHINYLNYVGFKVFIFGGYFGLVSLILSISYLYLLRIRIGILFGYIIIISFGINFLSIIIYILTFRNTYSIEIKFGFHTFLILWVILIIVYSLLLILEIKENDIDYRNIKKIIIEYGTNYTRISLGDLSQKCKQDKRIVKNIVKDMIENKEIHAKYFGSTQMVAFDQQANIEEIDNLMSIYEEFETKGIDKKEQNKEKI